MGTQFFDENWNRFLTFITTLFKILGQTDDKVLVLLPNKSHSN